MERKSPAWALALLLALAVAITAGCSGGDSPTSTRGESAPQTRIRKNAKDLTAQEKADFVEAVLRLKAAPSPYDAKLNYYDQFVTWHGLATTREGSAHASPAFLPWHRKLLLLYESALSEVAGRPIALPYWDWTDPASTAAVFADDLMGAPGPRAEDFAVVSGPFRRGQWVLNILPSDEDRDLNPQTWIVRTLGINDGGLVSIPLVLPVGPDVQSALAVPAYDVPPYDRTTSLAESFRNNLEGWVPPDFHNRRLHNMVHLWTGGFYNVGQQHFAGTMALVPTSVNDPAFFLHHCNVDRVFESWLREHPDSYVPVAGGLAGTNLHDPMYPFVDYRTNPRVAAQGLTPADMLSLVQLGYAYDRLVERDPNFVQLSCFCGCESCHGDCGEGSCCCSGAGEPPGDHGGSLHRGGLF